MARNAPLEAKGHRAGEAKLAPAAPALTTTALVTCREPMATSPPDPVLAAHRVGSIVDTDHGPWGRATATFDADRLYRYRLSRVWDASLPRVNFLMLNPSTADAFKLDPTVTRCANFAKDWGYGAVEVTNVFALRSTDPAGLKAGTDPVGGPANNKAITYAARAAIDSGGLVVAAWGVHATLGGRGRAVLKLLADKGIELHALRVTKAGHPGHPLYVPGNTVPFRFLG